MSNGGIVSRDARHAEQAADLLVTVASSLNERLAVTAGELARSQDLLRVASDELMTAFRGAADRIVAAQRQGALDQRDWRFRYVAVGVGLVFRSPWQDLVGSDGCLQGADSRRHLFD